MGSRSIITLARERSLNLGVSGTIYLITKCAAKGYTVNSMVCHLGMLVEFVFHALVQTAARNSASPSRHRARPQIKRDRAGGYERLHCRAGGCRDERIGRLDAFDLFRSYPGERLSGRVSLDPLYAFLVPCLGGLLFGLVTAYITRKRGTEVDPVEANALHGGRMSMRGSLIVAAQTVWSSGIGASVGLEAGYTQLASGIASKIGQAFRLRRGDLRVLVGCGAAGAIAGAFGAPLGGAFYGFELIIGSYSIASLAPVGMAALLGYLSAQAFTPDRLGIETGAVSILAVHDVVIAAGFGVLAAMFGIVLMRGVAACDGCSHTFM